MKAWFQDTFVGLRLVLADMWAFLTGPAPFPPIEAPAPAQPEPPHQMRIVLVGGPFHHESFVVRPQSHLASLLLRQLGNHTGDALYLRRAGDLDDLGRERWYFDRPSNVPAGDH